MLVKQRWTWRWLFSPSLRAVIVAQRKLKDSSHNYSGFSGEILPRYCLPLNRVIELISLNCNTSQNIDLEAKIFIATLFYHGNCQYDNGPQVSNL